MSEQRRQSTTLSSHNWDKPSGQRVDDVSSGRGNAGSVRGYWSRTDVLKAPPSSWVGNLIP